MNTDRFKFRAWYKNYDGKYEMIYDVQASYDNLAGGMGSIYHFNFQDVINDEDAIIEQCTGLKDKNGKLIYEGDVVRWYKSTAWGLGGERKGFVFFHDKFFSFGVESTLGDGYALCEIKEFEIIGNIHEMEHEK